MIIGVDVGTSMTKADAYDDAGRKLSKSTQATGLRELRAQGASAHDVRKMVGL